jgi:UDP-2,3-diacylglucosamine hydrolase
LFVSDLHLDVAYPDAGEQFLCFLQQEAPRADALYVLGDLFETWIGDDDIDPLRSRVCAALREFTAGGTPCYVMHGNRDFLLGAGFERLTGCRLLGDPTVIDLYGESVLLTHGDALCTADYSYQRLRATVRRPAWQRRFLQLPLPARRTLADVARAGSRAHTARMIPTIMDVSLPAVGAALRACGVRSMIHGHTHCPAVHRFELDGNTAQRVVLGAWYEQGSALRWTRDGYALEMLPRGGPE